MAEKLIKQRRNFDYSTFDLLKTISESAAIIDDSYRLLWTYEPLLNPETNIIGEFCHSAFAHRLSPCAVCPVRQTFETKKRQVFLKKVKNKSGSALFREVRVYPIVDDRGGVAHVIRISFDINGVKKNDHYHKLNTFNFRQALENLSKINLDNQEYLPDYNHPLSIREFEILHLASYGLSNPQMADILSISSHTVKSHFDHIFNKLGVSNRTMAVAWAARQGLI